MPEALPPGAVLVVGSGQTGCQLAEELRESGRKVFLACGRCVWVPRVLEGRDILWWMIESGFMDRTPDKRFADDLAASVDFGDARLADLLKFIEAYCTGTGATPPRFDMPSPLRVKTRTELDITQDGIGAVIWTSGYRPDYGWVKFRVLDDMGFPVQTDGRTDVPGLYFMGVHWMRKGKSSILYGVGEDAEVVAGQIIEGRS